MFSSEKEKGLGLAAVFVLVLVIVTISYLYPPADWKEAHRISVAQHAAASCVAAPGEKCPEANIILIGQDIRELQDELSTDEMRKKYALLNGYTNMLNANSPGPQFKYDFDKKRWVGPPPAPPAPAAAPAPAPAPAPANTMAKPGKPIPPKK